VPIGKLADEEGHTGRLPLPDMITFLLHHLPIDLIDQLDQVPIERNLDPIHL
jgi:hypothetical protein